MSKLNPTDEWSTGEHNQQSEQVSEASARPKRRMAPGKLPPAQAAAIASINERYRSDLNDEVGF